MYFSAGGNMGSFPILCIRKPAALSLSPSIFVFWLIGIFTYLSKHSEDCFVTGHLVTIQIKKLEVEPNLTFIMLMYMSMCWF